MVVYNTNPERAKKEPVKVSLMELDDDLGILMSYISTMSDDGDINPVACSKILTEIERAQDILKLILKKM